MSDERKFLTDPTMGPAEEAVATAFTQAYVPIEGTARTGYYDMVKLTEALKAAGWRFEPKKET